MSDSRLRPATNRREKAGSTASLDDLRDLHREIDAEANALTAIHAERLQCRRGCSGCCLDDLTVSHIEADRIRSAHSDLLENGEPHAVGGCAFLDQEGACRVYEDRPYVCRTQGLPLRVLIENDADEIEEHRDICPLNLDGGPPLESLDEDDCWLIGPFELRLGELDRSYAGKEAGKEAGTEPPRIALRDLFSSN